MVTITIQWSKPVSGVIGWSPTSFSRGYAGAFDWPSNAQYQYFENQQTWTYDAPDLLYTFAIVYGLPQSSSTSAELTFTIYVNGQPVVAKGVASCGTCIYHIPIALFVTVPGYGLSILNSLTCTGFDETQIGSSVIGFSMANTCSGITYCYECPNFEEYGYGFVFSTLSKIIGIGGNALVKNLYLVPISSSFSPPDYPSLVTIASLLTPPRYRSLIRSSLWNEMKKDIVLAYETIMEYLINFTDANYMNYLDFLNLPYQLLMKIKSGQLQYPLDYTISSVPTVTKGTPLTADLMNQLIEAIKKIANILGVQLPFPISKVIPNEIVTYWHFYLLVQNINYFLRFANYYLMNYINDANGQNLYFKDTSILNLVVDKFSAFLDINGQSYIKNLVLVPTDGTVTINDDTYVKNFVAESSADIFITDNAGVELIYEISGSNRITVNNYGSINTLDLFKSKAEITLNDYATIRHLNLYDSEVYLRLNDSTIVVYLNCYNSEINLTQSSGSSIISFAKENCTISS